MESSHQEIPLEPRTFHIETETFDLDRIKSKKCLQDKYIVLNNDPSYITFDDANLRLYRSVILDAETREIVCFSPPNSLDHHTFFYRKYPNPETLETPESSQEFIRTIPPIACAVPLLSKTYYVNEIMEGTMINLFYDKRRETWEIATRGSVGGYSWYYKTKYVLDERDHILKKDGLDTAYEQKNFRTMFEEALRGDKFPDNPIVQQLPREYTYSFVLQHPDNHIVLPIKEPHLFLVGVFRISQEKNTVQIISPTDYETWGCFSGGVIEFPPSRYIDYVDLLNNRGITEGEEAIRINSEEDEGLRKSLKQQIPWGDSYTLGYMITHVETQDRTTITNPAYEELKKLRGNNPNLQYHYFCLLRAGQQDAFVEHFPRYTKMFQQFHKQYHDFITQVHRTYFSYYVKKEKEQSYPKKYFIHASKIHHLIFLPSLHQEGGKKVITRGAVKEYLDEMKPSEILYTLHYDKRQLAVEAN